MKLVYLVAFFYGSLSFISDLISDSNIFVNYKTISEILFSLLTLYFIFYNKYMSFFKGYKVSFCYTFFKKY